MNGSSRMRSLSTHRSRGSVAEPLSFHAAPPSGHWLNDPNGLIYVDGAYRLFAQHRADAPEFRETGWARFSSADLLRWRFDGPAIPAAGSRWAYSGCVIGDRDRALSAFHTEHENGLERQVVRRSENAGLSWTDAEPVAGTGPPARNRRDPFVFRHGNGWAMLLAEPCDWHAWEESPASRLILYRSPDAIEWKQAGVIGPWRPQGIMWEVPVLYRIAGRDVLMVSEIDRRAGGAQCCVRGWVGELTAGDFVRDVAADQAGQLLDGGSIFYAMTGSTPGRWTGPDPVFVGWLSTWEHARLLPWPGFAGGPISLPRQISLHGANIAVHPADGIADAFNVPSHDAVVSGLACVSTSSDLLAFQLQRHGASLSVVVDPKASSLQVAVTGSSQPTFARTIRLMPEMEDASLICQVFIDASIVELFCQGIAVSLFMGGIGVLAATPLKGCELQIRWKRMPPRSQRSSPHR